MTRQALCSLPLQGFTLVKQLTTVLIVRPLRPPRLPLNPPGMFRPAIQSMPHLPLGTILLFVTKSPRIWAFPGPLSPRQVRKFTVSPKQLFTRPNGLVVQASLRPLLSRAITLELARTVAETGGLTGTTRHNLSSAIGFPRTGILQC